MYDGLVKSLRVCGRMTSIDDNCISYVNGCCEAFPDCAYALMDQAADAIEDLSAKVESLQFFVDNISKLPDCNTCLKKDLCEFMPKYGEYCRINCHAWLGHPQKEE